MSDIQRFTRSVEGQAFLTELRAQWTGRKIAGLEFRCGPQGILMELALDNGTYRECQLPELELDAIRDEFRSVLDREFAKDYPEEKRA